MVLPAKLRFSGLAFLYFYVKWTVDLLLYRECGIFWYICSKIRRVFMKKVIVFTVFFSLFVLVMPGTSLFADFSLGGRVDTGVDLFTYIPLATPVDNDITVLPVLPLFDVGFYGQVNTGFLNTGVGIRGFSLFYVNVFLPTVYAEVNLWHLTLNAQVGGGALYLFPIYMITGPYFVPEVSAWFNLTNSQTSKMQIGVGAMTLLSPQNIDVLKDELIQNFTLENFTNNVVFYVSFKFVSYTPWVTWKKEIESKK